MVNVYPWETGDYFQRVMVDGSWPTTAAEAIKRYEDFRPQISEDTELLAVDHREDTALREVALLSALIEVELVTDQSVEPYLLTRTLNGKYNRFFRYETPSGLVIAEKRVTLPREQASVGSFLRLMTEKQFDRSLNPETAQGELMSNAKRAKFHLPFSPVFLHFY